jgi:hypothetical protein
MQEAAQSEKVLFTRFFGGQNSQGPVLHVHASYPGAKSLGISWEILIFSQFDQSQWQMSAILTMREDQKRGFPRFCPRTVHAKAYNKAFTQKCVATHCILATLLDNTEILREHLHEEAGEEAGGE